MSSRLGRGAGGGSQRGQVLVLGLALLATVAAAAVAVFHLGSQVQTRLRLQDAADAAALSAATWQARNLNFVATMNRAVVANEAAIALSVSLRSWSAHMDRTLRNTSTATSWIPGVGQAMATLRRLWQGIDNVMRQGTRVAEVQLSIANLQLQLAAETLHLASVPATRSLAQAALAGTLPGARLSAGGEALLARQAAEHARLSRVYRDGERSRQADLMTRSRDGFTRERNARFAPPGVGVLTRLEKRGGTDLVGFDGWRAVDTFSLHSRGLFSGWRERVPIGWGAAETARSRLARGWHGGSYRTNPRASNEADGEIRRGMGYRGVPALRELTPAALRRDAELRVALRVELPAAHVPGAATALGIRRWILPSGAEALHATGDPRPLRAHGAAVVEYTRFAPRADGRSERPSLYQPYWRARLDVPTRGERLVAAGVDGDEAAIEGLLP